MAVPGLRVGRLSCGNERSMCCASNSTPSPRIMYSLGNLVSNQRWENSNGGIITTVDIDRATKKVVKIDYVPVYVHKGKLLNERRNYYCIPTPDYLDGKLPFTLPNDSLEADLRLFHTNTINRIPATPVE